MADRIPPDRNRSPARTGRHVEPGFRAGERALIEALAAAIVRELRAEGWDTTAACMKSASILATHT